MTEENLRSSKIEHFLLKKKEMCRCYQWYYEKWTYVNDFERINKYTRWNFLDTWPKYQLAIHQVLVKSVRQEHSDAHIQHKIGETRVFRDKRYKCQNLLGEHKIIVTFKNFTIPEKYDISDILIIDISQWIERTNSIEKEISNFNLLNRSKIPCNQLSSNYIIIPYFYKMFVKFSRWNRIVHLKLTFCKKPFEPSSRYVRYSSSKKKEILLNIKILTIRDLNLYWNILSR